MIDTHATQDQRVAQSVGTTPDQVRFAREEWNASPNGAIIRGIFKDRLTRQVNDRFNKLKSVKAEDLTKLQGEIAAIELSLDLTTTTPLNNE